MPVSKTVSQEPTVISNLNISVTLRAASKPGAVKAHADVRVDLPHSALEILGLSVVHHDQQKPPWVSYPQRADKNGKKYYAVIRVSGKLHEKISAAVLTEFERMSKSGSDSERVAIPREPGEDDNSF